MGSKPDDDKLSFLVFAILVKKVLDEILAYCNRDGRNFCLFVLRHPRVEHGVIINWL